MANFNLAVDRAIWPQIQHMLTFFLHFWSGKVIFGHCKQGSYDKMSRMERIIKDDSWHTIRNGRKKRICKDSGKDPICHILLSD